MKLADRVLNLKPSATLAVGALAQKLKAQGKPVISLSVGEPDFNTPDFISQAAIKAIEEGDTRYTPVPGTMEARKAVCRYFKHFYNVKAKAENIILSNGGKHCLFNALMSILDPGDQVIIPAPYWVSYPPIVEIAGAKPTIIPTSAEKAFKITCDDLEHNFTPKTKALILNSPSNPTGTAYNKKELDAIAQWGIDRGVIILSDEIYDRLVYPPFEPVSLSPWWEKHPENFIICGGMSKNFAMTGWRVGYILAHTELISAMSRLQGQSTSNICAIAQRATVAGLQSDFSCMKEMRIAFERRRNLAYERISQWPGVICPKPDGAFYLFPDMSAYFTKECPDSTSLCTKILDEVHVAMVPGLAFGNDKCIRISYALDDESLIEALDRVEKALIKK